MTGWRTAGSSATSAFSALSRSALACRRRTNPTGAYTLYAFSFGTTLNDYPKLGVWPTATNSAYLVTYNLFLNGQSFNGSDLCGFDRTKMLAGNASAAQICKSTQIGRASCRERV